MLLKGIEKNWPAKLSFRHICMAF